MVTTKDIAAETGLSQRAIQKRIDRLNIHPRRIGRIMVLTPAQVVKLKTMTLKVGRPQGPQK